MKQPIAMIDVNRLANDIEEATKCIRSTMPAKTVEERLYSIAKGLRHGTYNYQYEMTNEEYFEQFKDCGRIIFNIYTEKQKKKVYAQSTDAIDKIVNKYRNHNDDSIWSYRGLEEEDLNQLRTLCGVVLNECGYSSVCTPDYLWCIDWITTKGCQWEIDFMM